MSRNYFLGIDCSNYTTSLALMDGEGALLENRKLPLPVAEGARGLRQSDAVFAHVKNLPRLFNELAPALSSGKIVAVGVSEAPRRAEGSYMPCFLSGVAAATAVSAALDAPLYRFSHQCGHLAAALFSAGRCALAGAPFGAFHVSGGTTDVLYISGLVREGFSVQRLGGTRDLNAGQLVDRVGVMLGLSFPAGRALEALAAENTGRIPRPRISVKGLDANLSGAENLASALFERTKNAPLVAAFTLEYIAKTLEALTLAILEEKGNIPLVYAGGVMSNRYIRTRLLPLGDTAFAEPALSADNAVGIAWLCRHRYGEEHGA